MEEELPHLAPPPAQALADQCLGVWVWPPVSFTFQFILAPWLPLGLQKLKAEEGESQLSKATIVDVGTELR